LRVLGDDLQGFAGPGAVGAGAVQPVQAHGDVFDVRGGQGVGRGELVAGVGIRHRVHAEQVDRVGGVATEVGAGGGDGGIAGGFGVLQGDAGGFDDLDLVDHEAAGGGAVDAAGDDLARAPAAEHHGDAAVPDADLEAFLDPHARETRACRRGWRG